jgi:uncharacterized protein with PQ loop repeat
MLYSIVPQLVLNYRLQYAKGISDFTIFGNLNMNLMGIMFIFGCNLIWLYRVMGSLGCVLFLILIAQRIGYHWPESKKILAFFLLNILFFTCCLLLLVSDPAYYGNLYGWIGVGLQFVYMVPQLLKIVRTQSVEGFSFIFLTLLAGAFVFEFIGAVILDLPLSIKVNDIRGLIFYLIFCFLFWKYRR